MYDNRPTKREIIEYIRRNATIPIGEIVFIDDVCDKGVRHACVNIPDIVLLQKLEIYGGVCAWYCKTCGKVVIEPL